MYTITIEGEKHSIEENQGRVTLPNGRVAKIMWLESYPPQPRFSGWAEPATSNDYCEASGRCFCIIETERDEDTMPALIFGPKCSRVSAETELKRRQALGLDDPDRLPEQCIVTTCKVSLVYWNGAGDEPSE